MEESAIRDPGPTRIRDRSRRAGHRRGLALGLAAAALVHGVAIAFLAVPGGDLEPGRAPLVLTPQPVPVEDRVTERSLPDPASPVPPETERTPSRPERPSAPHETSPIRTPVPGDRSERPTEETIPSTTLLELRGAPLPLVTTETGIARRTVDRDPARLARARAESILAVRFGTPIASEPTELGPTTLSNGGVTIAIPWQGFVRDDRKDDVWRKERCEGGDKKGDKPGESEAKSAQCK